jgi:hypothetical protein
MNARQPQPCPDREPALPPPPYPQKRRRQEEDEEDMVYVKLSNEAVFSKEQIARFFGDSLDFKGHTKETYITFEIDMAKMMKEAGIK